MRKCPHCLKKISDTARKCKFCGEWLEERENIMSNKDTYSRAMKNRNVTFADNYINNGSDEKKQVRKSSYKYLIFIIPIIFVGILFLIPRMESASPAAIEYAKQTELAQKNNGSLNKNQQNSNCSKIIKEKYGIIDEYAKCTGKISGQGVMGGDQKELMTKWGNDCVRNLLNNYPKTNSYSYVGCYGTGLEIINILDNFYTKFSQCFNQAAAKKASTPKEAQQLIQNTFNCNDKTINDYAKIMPYADYLYSL